MAYAQARDIGVESIPVIDLAPLADGSRAGAEQVAREMRSAAETIGFWYVKNHGIPERVLRDVQSTARRFFHFPEELKQQLKPLDRHRGFLSVGQAKMSKGAKVDLKESYIWGLDIAADDPEYTAGDRLLGPNRWPEFLPELRGACNAWFDATNDCGIRLLRAFAASLGVETDYFTGMFRRPVTRGSAVFYPPQPPDAGEDQFGVAPHTDYGVLTFVLLDDAGGLQVLSKDREWVHAHPIEGALVVNVGDLLARWTNNRFKSTPHRVVNASGRERLSIASFVDPDFDTPIRPVAGVGETSAYPEVTCGEYILGRYNQAFAYRGKR